MRKKKKKKRSLCARCWAAAYCLTWDSTHSGSRGTRQTNNTVSTNTQSLSCLIGGVLIYIIFRIRDILSWIPFMHSWCHPRLTALRRVLDALWTQRACLPLRAAPTSWWSRVAAGRLGPRSSIDVWLSKLADSPEKSSTRQRWRGAPERVVLSKGIACIRFKELIARLRVRTIYCISCLA